MFATSTKFVVWFVVTFFHSHKTNCSYPDSYFIPNAGFHPRGGTGGSGPPHSRSMGGGGGGGGNIPPLIFTPKYM